jgi:hypothetical protein
LALPLLICQNQVKRTFANDALTIIACMTFCVAAICARVAPFRYSSVCDRCGAVQRGTDWQIRNTEITLFRTSSETASPVSRALFKTGLAGSHPHHWLFAAGRGYDGCALGRGNSILPAVNSEGVARLIEALDQYGEVRFREKLLTNLFAGETAYAVRTLPVPTAGFSNDAECRSWIVDNESYFDDLATAFRPH